MSQLDRLNCCFVEPVGRKWLFFSSLDTISILAEIKLFSLFFFSFPDQLSSQTTSFPQNIAFGQTLQFDI